MQIPPCSLRRDPVPNLGREEGLIPQRVTSFEWTVASNIIFSVYGTYVLIMELTFKKFLVTLWQKFTSFQCSFMFSIRIFVCNYVECIYLNIARTFLLKFLDLKFKNSSFLG